MVGAYWVKEAGIFKKFSFIWKITLYLSSENVCKYRKVL